MGMFSPFEYDHTTPKVALFQIGCFITAVFGLCAVVATSYPDKQSAPREFEGGLEAELGGPTAVRVCEIQRILLEGTQANITAGTYGWRRITISESSRFLVHTQMRLLAKIEMKVTAPAGYMDNGMK